MNGKFPREELPEAKKEEIAKLTAGDGAADCTEPKPEENNENYSQQNGENGSEKLNGKKKQGYICYCVLTVTVALFTLAFAATELFGAFFSEGHPAEFLMSRAFGETEAGLTLEEILLSQSFTDLSFSSKQPSTVTKATPETTKSPETTRTPETTAKPGETTAPVTTSPTAQTTTPNAGQTTASPSIPPDIYGFNPSAVPAGELAIIPMDLSLYASDKYFYNDTSYELDYDKIKSAMVLPGSKVFPTNAPLVLIVHTHATESYMPDGALSYKDEGDLARSNDISENVVAVGAAFAETLNANGITTIHIKTLHDEESYKNSYARSAETIKKYLDAYPTIQYVFDIHRDSVLKSTGELVRPITVADGEITAQVMAVVGSDSAGTANPNWKNNLSFAHNLRAKLNGEYHNMCRPAYLKATTYNQQYATVSLLLEIGSSGNSLGEAVLAARLTGEAVAELIKSFG